MGRRESHIVTIQLTQEQYQSLNHLRAQTNRPMAELVRCAIDSYLSVHTTLEEYHATSLTVSHDSTEPC